MDGLASRLSYKSSLPHTLLTFHLLFVRIAKSFTQKNLFFSNELFFAKCLVLTLHLSHHKSFISEDHSFVSLMMRCVAAQKKSQAKSLWEWWKIPTKMWTGESKLSRKVSQQQ